MSAEEFVVAVDVGGSLTKIAYADRRGRLGNADRLRTHLEGGSDGLVRWLATQITERAAARPADTCVGYGVVVPGIIDSATGTVRAAPNVGWYDVPLRDRLSELTGLPGAVGHDVRSGGLAEWRRGGGSGVSNLLFLPLGTGIAGAMIVDGRLLEADGFAGEIGHIRVAAAGATTCACGQVGCLETVASASGVTRSYLRLTEAQGVSPTSVPAKVLDARDVAARARTGEAAALSAFAIATDALTEALMLYLTLLGPEVVVIGGGLAGAADLFVPQISRAIQSRVAFQRVPRIVTALLGADAGVIGAGLLGWDDVLAKRQGTPGDQP
jgi:glucokinase